MCGGARCAPQPRAPCGQNGGLDNGLTVDRMLSTPVNLLRRYSDYQYRFIDAEALLRSCLGDRPATRPACLRLDEVHRLGWRSPDAKRLYEAACRKLEYWCIDHGHYANNVLVWQEIRLPVEQKEYCLPQAPVSAPTKKSAGWKVLSFAGRKASDAFQKDGFDRTRNVPSWSVALRNLTEMPLLLIDAPLCFDKGDDGFLCDYPDFVRRREDMRVPLLMSKNVQSEILSAIGGCKEWYPFARLMGVVHQESQGARFEVFQVSLRLPRSDELNRRRDFGFAEDIIGEASGLLGCDSEVQWLGKMVSALDAGYSLNLFSEPDEALIANLSLALYELIRSPAYSSAKVWARQYGSPYEGDQAFWCGLAALAPQWQKHFPFTPMQVTALLRIFDKQHDEKWHSVAKRLEGADVLRYTPSVMAEARNRLASRANPPNSAGAP